MNIVTPNGPTLFQLRKDTPGCKKVIHLNNAGCALPCRQVMEATQRYYSNEALYGGYEIVQRHCEELRKPYKSLAKLLNCTSSEIAVVSSATSAWQQVMFGMKFKEDDVVLTTLNEYGSNYINLLQLQKRCGIAIIVIPENENGDLDLVELDRLMEMRKPKLITLTHVPTNSGNVYDAVAVGKIAKAYGVPYLLDGCQSVGQMEIDVQAIGCDFFSATSRKFLRGPRGVGFLYISQNQLDNFEPCTLDVRSASWDTVSHYHPVKDATRFEQYELNFAAKVGFGVALEYCLSLDMKWINNRISQLSTYFRQQLQTIPGITVHDHCSTLCGIVSFTKASVPAEEIVSNLLKQKVNMSVSYVTSTRLKMEKKGLRAIVRASIHYYNTLEELEFCLNALN